MLVLAVVVLLTRNPNKPPSEATLTPVPATSPAPTRPALTELPSATATPTTAAQAAQQLKNQLNSLGTGANGLSGKNGSVNLPGLPGGTSYKYASKHKIRITVTSKAPIGTIGYFIPYSPDHQSGKASNVGTSWSLNTISYGNPDYARVYVLAGPDPSKPITVTIYVDGKPHSRTTDGPYAYLIFQA